jgi:hypothetical protein
MHLIIVSDDFKDFMHIHPALGSDGIFRLEMRFPHAALYHLYADALPSGFGHCVFRFDVNVGSTSRHGDARAAGTQRNSVDVGPYAVRLSELRVAAGTDAPVIAAITKAGYPATDLHIYLGAFAHVVALGVTDLSYTHVHAMDPRSMSMNMDSGGGHHDSGSILPANAIVPATMSVHLKLPRRGTYKVWIEFRGGSTLYAAPFAVTAY